MRMPTRLRLPALSAVIALMLVACGPQGEEVERRSSALQAADGSGATGEVVLTKTLAGSRLDFDVAGLDEGWYRAQLREGSCETPGPVVRELGRAGTDASGALAFSADFEEPAFEDVADRLVVAIEGEDEPDRLVLCGSFTGGV